MLHLLRALKLILILKSRAGSEVSQTEGLNPEFADDLERATKAGEAATGQKASFTSLVRSKEKQAELYYNYIHGIGGQGLAAKPGTSLHERGMAADLAEGSTRDWVRAHAGDYGMELVPGDPEHVQLAKSRQAIAGAEAAKAASNKDVIAKADAPRRPEHPSSRNEGQVSQYGKSPTPHLGDVSQFQGDPYIKVHVSNPAGANVVTQVASLGVAQGNFHIGAPPVAQQSSPRPPLPANMTTSGLMLAGNGVVTHTIGSSKWQHPWRFVTSSAPETASATQTFARR